LVEDIGFDNIPKLAEINFSSPDKQDYTVRSNNMDNSRGFLQDTKLTIVNEAN